VAKQPNERLRVAMLEAGLSNKSLARAVRVAAAERGRRVSYDHTSVTRWFAGGIPRSDTVEALCDVLSARVGRRVTADDIGMTRPKAIDPALGLVYPDTVDGAIHTLAELWSADLADDSALASAAVGAAAWPEASLAWLVRAGRDEIGVRAEGLAVGQNDVVALRSTAATFAALDNQFGGRHARRALVEFLRTDLAPMLAGKYSSSVGRDLLAAGAEATMLAAWMSYDAGLHGIAQRYFVQGLRLAQGADNPLLAATILDAMSHQATFLGRFREAANLARAAGTGAGASATATLKSHFRAMEARALAAAGDVVGTHRALSDAVHLFEARDGDDPSWISYVDDAELAAELAHCYRDIGRAQDTIRYAQIGLTPDGSSPRSDYFVTMVLATGHLQAGELDAACEVAQRGIDAAARLKSARAAEYLRQFRAKLAPYEATAAVASFNERATLARLS